MRFRFESQLIFDVKLCVTQSISEVAAFVILIISPLAASAYLFAGILRARVTGAIRGRGSCCNKRWEDSPVHSEYVPVAVSPLKWARIPLPPGTAAVVNITPTLKGIASPRADEVYRAIIQLPGTPLDDEHQSVSLDDDARLAGFESAYDQLMARLLSPDRSRELLDAIARHGPQAAFVAFNQRLDLLRENLIHQAKKGRHVDAGGHKSGGGSEEMQSPLTMQEYRNRLDSMLSTSDNVPSDKFAASSSTWPMRANRVEPTSISLEADMKRVLRVIEGERQTFARLGFAVHIAMHMHRDGNPRGTASRIFQKWWLTFTDLDHGRKPDDNFAPPRVMPNAWLGTYGATGLRMDEPLFMGPSVSTVQNVSLRLRQGTAIEYDRFGSVLCFPSGVCCAPLPLVAIAPPGHKGKARVQPGRLGRKFEAAREGEQVGAFYMMASDVALGKGNTDGCSVRSAKNGSPLRLKLLLRDQHGRARDPLLLEGYRELLRELRERNHEPDEESGGQVQAQVRENMYVALVLDGMIQLPPAAWTFPRFLYDASGVARLSVHMCLSDCLHRKMDAEIDEPGPVRDRHTLCWLTIVDLELRRPVGGYNLPMNAPYSRETYTVPAELQLHDLTWARLPPPPPPPPPPAPPPPRRRHRLPPKLHLEMLEPNTGTQEKYPVQPPATPKAQVAALTSEGDHHGEEPHVIHESPAVVETSAAELFPIATSPAMPPHLSGQSSSTAAKQAFKSVRNLLPKGMRRQRSFWQDSFEDESSKGTREGPGRRSCVASLNARAASTPAQAGVALKSPPSRAKSSTSADLLQTHDGRQLSQDKTRPSVAKSEAGAVTDTSSSNPPVPTPLRTNASLAGRAVTFKDMTMAAGTSAPSTAPVQPPLLSAQSSSTAAKQAFKSVRNLLPKGMRRQRSFWQDSFEDESSKGTREGPGRRSCVASLNARAASTPAQAGVALKSPPSRKRLQRDRTMLARKTRKDTEQAETGAALSKPKQLNSRPGQLETRGKDDSKVAYRSVRNLFGRQRSFWQESGGTADATTDRPGRLRRGSLATQTETSGPLPTRSPPLAHASTDRSAEAVAIEVSHRQAPPPESTGAVPIVTEPALEPSAGVQPQGPSVGLTASLRTSRITLQQPESSTVATSPSISMTTGSDLETGPGVITAEAEPMAEQEMSASGLSADARMALDAAEAKLRAAVVEIEYAEELSSRRHGSLRRCSSWKSGRLVSTPESTINSTSGVGTGVLHQDEQAIRTMQVNCCSASFRDSASGPGAREDPPAKRRPDDVSYYV